MAQFTGFTCDACDDIVKSEERVRKITRFESEDPDLAGEGKMDLCPACARRHRAEPGIGWVQPLRRRRKAGEQDESGEGSPEAPGSRVDAHAAPSVTSGLPAGERPQPLPK